MAAQHDLGSGWHAAFCAVKTPECISPSILALLQRGQADGERVRDRGRERDMCTQQSTTYTINKPLVGGHAKVKAIQLQFLDRDCSLI